MSRILVTGGAGFIGSYLVERLSRAGHEILVIDDSSSGSVNELQGPGIWKMLEADCRDEKKMDDLIGIFKPEIVFHLAANAAENKAQFSPVDITSRNFDAFIKVLKASIKGGAMKRFVFTSSIAVYGQPKMKKQVKLPLKANGAEYYYIPQPFLETDLPEPEDLYGISKLAAEQALKVMSKVHDFEYVIARPHNVYGPRQNMKDPYRNVVTIWMNAIMRNEPYHIYGDGKQQRCFSYIDDVADALFKCGFEDVAGKTFNIGSDAAYTLNSLSDAVRNVSGSAVEPVYLPERPQEIAVATADHALAKTHLNYADSVSLEEGLRSTWEWAQSVGPCKPEYGELELVNKKVPKNWL